MEDGKRALWTKLVADFELSGQSQREFAEQRQVELNNLRYWIYKLRNESRPLATKSIFGWVAEQERTRPGADSDRLVTRCGRARVAPQREARWGTM